MLDTSLEKAKNLRNAFLYGIGARYVKGLKDKGGWASVNARYKFPPRTTAAILNPELYHHRPWAGPIGRRVRHDRETGGSPGARSRSRSRRRRAGSAIASSRTARVKAWQLAFHAEEATRFEHAYAALSPGRAGP